MRVFNGLKLAFSISIIVGLLFSSALFSVLLYAKMTDKQFGLLSPNGPMQTVSDGNGHGKSVPAAEAPAVVSKPAVAAGRKSVKEQSLLSAPIVNQLPELPAGCEVTSLTMLLQFSGLKVTKLSLAAEMKKDVTPIVYNKDGSIQSWGNPNVGFVGDVYRRKAGFGIFHGPLYQLLKQYIPTAVDLTGQSFKDLEAQLANGVPVVVWTTIDFKLPNAWVTWKTDGATVRTTVSEHAVLMVGYDQKFVYVNDPLSGKKQQKVDKAHFIHLWEIMGKQALSYTNQ